MIVVTKENEWKGVSFMNFKSPLQVQAYETIKKRILDGGFEKNVLYSETKLASELGISRTPMREALQCLAQDGYITVIPKMCIRDRSRMMLTTAPASVEIMANLGFPSERMMGFNACPNI